jgi:alpha-L-fucosidase 2
MRHVFLPAFVFHCLLLGKSSAAEPTPPPPPTPPVIPGVVITTDIGYGGPGGNESQRLDAAVPEGPGPFPMVIIVHGGGWSSGDKAKDIIPLFAPLSHAHFTWFSINYRLAPKDQWPACFDDVQTAIRWVKAHAAEYKGDPNRLVLIGYSAGGHLICQAVVTAKDDTRVQAAIGLAPPTDLVADTQRRGGISPSLSKVLGCPVGPPNAATLAILHDLSPINYVKAGLPPFLLIHGTADQSVPYSQSINFQARLKQAGVPCQLITIQGAPHNIGTWEKLDPQYINKMIAWIQQTLGLPPTPL